MGRRYEFDIPRLLAPPQFQGYDVGRLRRISFLAPLRRSMTDFYVHTTNEPLWRDAARRLRRSQLVTDRSRAEAEVFDGAAIAKLPAIRAAIDAGRHAVVAAEPGLSQEQLASLAEAARGKGVLFAMLNPERFLPSRELMLSQLAIGEQSGPLGTPEFVRAHRWENHVAPAPLGLPGPLVGEIEIASQLFLRPVRTVFALRPAGLSAWQLHLGFCPGMAVIDYCDSLQGTTAVGYRSLSIIGSRGSTQIDDHTNTQPAYVGGSGPTGLTVGEGVVHLTKLLDYAAGMLELGGRSKAEAEAKWLASVSQAEEIVAAVEAVKKSLATGEAVTLETREAAR
jgi:predicted dehydrogenase